MLNMIFVDKQLKVLSTGESLQYISVPEKSYVDLKKDFKQAPHFRPVDTVELFGAKGVMIKCEYEQDGLLAASYLYKKYVETPLDDEESDDTVEEDFVEEIIEEFGDEADEELEDEIDKALYDGVTLKNLPVIHAYELERAYNRNNPFSWGNGPFTMQLQQEEQNRMPYWFSGKYPLIVLDSGGAKPIEAIRQVGRFIIYISSNKNSAPFVDADYIDSMERAVIFEQDFEICHIEKPDSSYYETVLKEYTKVKDFKLSRSIEKAKLIDELKIYRGRNFDSNRDIYLLVNKAIRKKNDGGKTLVKADFEKVFIKHSNYLQQQKLQNSIAQKELEKLIGLESVKAQLKRLVKRMKFGQMRKSQGYKSDSFHCSAIFMGNPGTAKTTIARIFGRMLSEEGVLENDGFFEVSRKDLVGMYVGHTAPTVAKTFEMARGGTIFIDEAYSLMSEGLKDSFSDEAMSEIIRQMENNPQTLVIFAGYPEEMKKFILNANPGLRSRLTNIIEFPDYTDQELIEIFTYLIEREDYHLEDLKNAKEIIYRFIRELKTYGTKNSGNGRAMRKLYQSAVSYMAERSDNDLRTIKPADIERAAQEIIQSERLLSSGHRNTVGFLGNIDTLS